MLSQRLLSTLDPEAAEKLRRWEQVFEHWDFLCEELFSPWMDETREYLIRGTKDHNETSAARARLLLLEQLEGWKESANLRLQEMEAEMEMRSDDDL